LRIAEDDDTQEYLFGSIEERHADYDVLSTASPMGKAIAGAAPGEQRSYEGPRGTLSVEVVSVRSPD
jgi:transcription elongation GreA/GreB family factor